MPRSAANGATKLFVGRPVLVVVDLQAEGFVPDGPIPIMPGYGDVVAKGVELVEAARERMVPVIFVKEEHSRTHVDFGRELDGPEESVHDIEDDPLTDLVEELRPLADEYLVVKRRYSAFFGTDLEILLRGLQAETLVLCGGLTNVCVQYTYIDAHQNDYYVKVAEDAVIGSSPEAHRAALTAMAYFQEGALRSTEELAAGLRAYDGPPRPPVQPLRSAAKVGHEREALDDGPRA